MRTPSLGRLPNLSSLAAFSTAVSSGLLIIVYLFHSYLCLGWRNASKYLAIALSVSYVIEANFVAWFITSFAFFVAFYLVTGKRVTSSIPAIGFYFLFGMDDAISDVLAGLGLAGGISIVLFASASVLLYLRLGHRLVSGQVTIGRTPRLQLACWLRNQHHRFPSHHEGNDVSCILL